MTANNNVTAFDPTMSQYESRFIDVGEKELKTHYIEAGRGEPLILVHGGGPGADGYGNWHLCLPEFSKHFHSICVDMLGFGKTNKPDPDNFVYSQDARTQHMIEFIEALDIGPVCIAGNSMGGLTSLGVSIDRPDLVKKVILMGPAGIKDANVTNNIQALLNYNGTIEAMREVIKALTYKDYQVEDALVEYRVKVSTEADTLKAQMAAMAWIREQGGLYFEDERIKQLTKPALVVGGKNDPIVTIDHIFKFLQLIDNSWGYLIPHCGHWVMMEHPQEFVSICLKFLNDSD